MPNSNIPVPVSSVACDRLVLGVGWVRPAAGSIGGTLNPLTATGWVNACYGCFEGSEE